MTLNASDIFTKVIPGKLSAKADAASSMTGVYEFNLTGDGGGVWTVDFTQAGGKIAQGSSGKADCTLTVAAKDFSDMIEGSLNPQMAFMTGKLKVQGNIGMALKLGNII